MPPTRRGSASPTNGTRRSRVRSVFGRFGAAGGEDCASTVQGFRDGGRSPPAPERHEGGDATGPLRGPGQPCRLYPVRRRRPALGRVRPPDPPALGLDPLPHRGRGQRTRTDRQVTQPSSFSNSRDVDGHDAVAELAEQLRAPGRRGRHAAACPGRAGPRGRRPPPASAGSEGKSRGSSTRTRPADHGAVRQSGDRDLRCSAR